MPVAIHTDTKVLAAENAYGRLLTHLAEEAGLQLNTRCGSAGFCGGCAVKLEEGDFVIGSEHISLVKGDYRVASACQTRVVSEHARVRFPRTSVLDRDAKIEDDFTIRRFRLEAQTGKYAVQVPEAALGHVAGMWESARAEVIQACGMHPLDIPLPLLRQLPEVLIAGNRKLTITVGRRERGASVIDVEAGDTTAVHIGAAADLGTTTVVMMLVDLDQGRVLRKASMYNQQIQRADDVASRIAYAGTPEQLAELRELLVEHTLNRLLEIVCREQGIDAGQICRIAFSGNTVMTHLLLGLSPAGIGRLPFRPVVNSYGRHRARDLGVDIHPFAMVDIVPSVSGYVGGDVVADIYVSRLRKHPELCMLVDIGTNGEIVLSERDQLVATATAAGPAFEGYGITQGCRAATGAVEHLCVDSELNISLEVIGQTPPTGFCGSAIIDFVAEGQRCGLINSLGRFDLDFLKASGRYLHDEALCGPSHACLIVPAEHSGLDHPLFVSELDVAEVLKAKAAIYAGMRTLLDRQGKTFSDLHRLFLAGGFARHINLRNAIMMGLLPDMPVEQMEIIGNGSLAGAFLALLDRDAMSTYEALARVPEVVELNLQPAFQGHFVDALALPNLDAESFPSVVRELGHAH